MKPNNYNNSFFSWNGVIGQKDYAINLFILFALVCLLQFLNFNALFGDHFFLNSILYFLRDFLQFVFVISVLSVVYRRINDFSAYRTKNFRKFFDILFGVLFVFPVLYFFVFMYLLDFIPILVQILNLVAIFIGILGIITSLIFCFIKGKTID